MAAEEGGGTSNFLIPNGTFFFVLAIFLIVLGVIGKFVVPPIQKVLGERERMVAKTTEDNRRAAEQEAAAEADYHKELAAGRAEAAGIRDQARAEGRAVLDDMRGRANERGRRHAAGGQRRTEAAERLHRAEICGPRWRHLSVTLASRVLGVPVDSARLGTASGR